MTMRDVVVFYASASSTDEGHGEQTNRQTKRYEKRSGSVLGME
jgi:hypothetical protein